MDGERIMRMVMKIRIMLVYPKNTWCERKGTQIMYLCLLKVDLLGLQKSLGRSVSQMVDSIQAHQWKVNISIKVV